MLYFDKKIKKPQHIREIKNIQLKIRLFLLSNYNNNFAYKKIKSINVILSITRDFLRKIFTSFNDIISLFSIIYFITTTTFFIRVYANLNNLYIL